jgi:hypothetical protein
MMADQANQVLRGVKLDLLTKPPMFGIPVLGNLLNIPGEVAGLVTSQIPSLTPEGSPALQVAQQQGVGESWDQRSDLSDAAKLGIEFGVSQAIPGFAVTGPLKPVSNIINSPALSLVKAAEKKVPQLPVVGKAFQPSSKAVVQAAKEDAGSILEYSKRQNTDAVSYYNAIQDLNAGKITAAEAAPKMNLGTAQVEQLAPYFKTLKPEAMQSLPIDNNMYGAAMNQIEKQTATDVGLLPKPKPSPIQGAVDVLKGANQITRETAMSGGTTWIANFVSMISSAQLEGISVPKFMQNIYQFVKNKGQLQEYDSIVGQLPLDGRLGINKNAIVGLDADTQKGILDKLGPINSSLIGGILGATTGDPLAIVAGGLGGALTVAGFKGNRALMSLGEAVARETYFVKGFDNFMQSNQASVLKEFTDTLGPQKGAMMNDALKAINYRVAPENLPNVALQLGFSGDDVSRSVQAWRNVHAAATDNAVNFSNSIAFNYTRDSNLTQALRNYTPFPVWPLHNLPYYAEKMAQYPLITAMAGDYLESTTKRNEDLNNPQRLDMRTPIADVGGGTVYGNPMSPLAITSQLQEPFPAAPGVQQSPIEKATDLLGVIGLSPSTPLQWLGQVTGVLDQGRDFQSFFPATRLIQPASEALLGKVVNPEAGIQAGLEGIRSQAAPASSPTVPYNEYLIRKKLAEMALDANGKAWFQDDAYSKAMIDHNDPLWVEATKQVGTEQANMYVARRLVPAQLSYISTDESKIRQAQKDLGTLPNGMTGAQYGQIMTDNPWAFGYKDISDEEAVLNLEVKQNLYYRIPAGVGRTQFRKDNPDFAAYMSWYGTQKQLGNKPLITDYVKQLGVN